MLNDFESVNRILAELADEGILEPMVEPIDEIDADPFDYAEVTGLWDEMYPEPIEAIDNDGNPWYLI
jgi:hypothetical protein